MFVETGSAPLGRGWKRGCRREEAPVALKRLCQHQFQLLSFTPSLAQSWFSKENFMSFVNLSWHLSRFPSSARLKL